MAPRSRPAAAAAASGAPAPSYRSGIPKSKSAAAKRSPLATLLSSYVETTPTKLKLVDAFLAYLMLSGIIQFAYAVLITNFPFNSFLAGFSATVGQFVLAASLRMQANPANQDTYKSISPERCVAPSFFLNRLSQSRVGQH